MSWMEWSQKAISMILKVLPSIKLKLSYSFQLSPSSQTPVNSLFNKVKIEQHIFGLLMILDELLASLHCSNSTQLVQCTVVQVVHMSS